MYDNEKYIEMIPDLLDGQLDSVSSDSLLKALGESQELREYFNSFVAVRNSSQKAALTAPPASLTASIMSGLDLPLTPAAAVESSFLGAAAIGAIKVALPMITGALMVIAYMWLVPGPEDNPPQAMAHKVIIEHKFTDEQPTETANDISTENVTTASAKPIIRTEIPKQGNVNMLNESAYVTDKFCGTRDLQRTNQLVGQENKADALFDFDNTLKEYDFSIELYESQDWNYPKETIAPANLASLNNYGLRVMYNINNRWSIGADVRQETFFQKFDGYYGAQPQVYEQQPNLTSYTAVAAFRPVILWDKIRPGVSVAIGGNQLGIVSRLGLSIGLVHGPLGFAIDFNYNRMDYTFQNYHFYSEKLGVKYGVSYEF